MGITTEEIAVTRFSPQGEPWGSLVIAGAMGVRQDFYAPLAKYFAAHGLHVQTFDYRGMGFSRRGSLRPLDVDVGGWAREDLEPRLAEAEARAPGMPVFLLGHSLGGQLLGVLRNHDRVRAAITVTAGSGYYRLNDRMKLEVRVFWFLAIPLLTPLFGYFPGKRLRMVGDLPRNVAWQWRRWCLHPDYLLSESDAWRQSYAKVRAPILSWSFADDRIITRSGIDDLHRRYAGSTVERRHVEPEGGERIGHFGFFSERKQQGWEQSLQFLRAHAP